MLLGRLNFQVQHLEIYDRIGDVAMGTHYSHMRPEERAVIQIGVNHHLSIREVARILERSPSSICRELHRLTGA